MSNIYKFMKKIAFIVDTCSTIKNSELKDVYVLPLTINITNKKTNEIKSYRDLVDITGKDLEKYLDSNDYTVTTSQSSAGDIIKLVEKIYDKYDEIYVLPIPLFLSGSANTWELISKDYEKLVVGKENKNVVEGIKWDIMELQEMTKNNTLNPKTFNRYIEKVQKTCAGVLFVSDITQLSKGGRVSNFKSMLLKLMRLKIVIMCDKNGLKFFKTTKNFIKGFDIVINEYKKRISGFDLKKIKKVCFQLGPSNKKNPEMVKLINYVKGLLPPKAKLTIDTIPNVILAHTGAKAIVIKLKI